MNKATDIARASIDEQVDALHVALSSNDILIEVLIRARTLGLPGWYLAAGCLFQTVWNVVTDQPPTEGIGDYDLPYFDSTDLSWEAEDAVIQSGQEIFGDLPAPVEIRNEARVHLWYEKKFGVACPPYPSTEGAIDSFPATTSCLGVRLGSDGRWRIYAPHGFSDLFNLIVRPNPVLAPRQVYETKTDRWRRQWPDLTVLPWPG